MLLVKFKYKDEYTKNKWKEQYCIVFSIKECENIYGLGIDCDYKIISIEEI